MRDAYVLEAVADRLIDDGVIPVRSRGTDGIREFYWACSRRALERRRELGATASTIANRAGISLATLRRFELRQSLPKPSTVSAILKALYLDPVTLESRPLPSEKV